MDTFVLDWANLLLRWAQAVVVIAWIGSSFYFVFLENSLPPPTAPMPQGRADRGVGQAYLAQPNADGEEARTLRPLRAAAATYRIAFGPRAGQKMPTFRSGMPREAAPRQPLCADIDGFGLHAAVRVEAHDRERLEQLCRYTSGPALSDERVQLNAAGQIELKLKTPRRDETTRRPRPRPRPPRVEQITQAVAHPVQAEHRDDPCRRRARRARTRAPTRRWPRRV